MLKIPPEKQNAAGPIASDTHSEQKRTRLMLPCAGITQIRFRESMATPILSAHLRAPPAYLMLFLRPNYRPYSQMSQRRC